MIVDLAAVIGLAAQIEEHVAYRYSQQRWGDHVGLKGDLAALAAIYPLLPAGFFFASKWLFWLEKDFANGSLCRRCCIKVQGRLDLYAGQELLCTRYEVEVVGKYCETSDPAVAAFAIRLWEQSP